MAPDVSLVSMPFGSIFSPSIGLSLLQAGLAGEHLTSRVHYFTIRFAESIGRAVYSGIAEDGRPALEDLAGDWLFCSALSDDSRDDRRYVAELLEDYYSDAVIARLLKARDRVDSFLDECLDTLLKDPPRIVGFTSMFQQHTASLALARRIRQAAPSTFIVFGGANCEGVMGAETVRSFPFVDAAVSGEADLVFPELVRRVLDGASVAGLPGVRSRQTIEEEFARGVFSNGPMVRDMDRLPMPDYRDYFEQFKASRYDRDWKPSVFLETSRGCWWGERMHCTFCGLNGAAMTFRSKSPARAIAEIAELTRRYPGCDIQAVDNIIDFAYFKELLPALVDRRLKARLFYETKSNLKKEHVRLLRRAGVFKIQPGIENFSDTVLRLMRKGVTGIQNIQLLKWCKQFGVESSWNFLWGFPGEPPEEYARQSRLVPLLTHLAPPVAHAKIRLDRFSPNYFDAGRLGFADVKPLPAYEHIYRLSPAAVANLASYFSFAYAEPRDVDRYTRRLARELEKWKRAAPRSELLSVDAGAHQVIVDLRPLGRAPFTVLGGLARFLYRECDAVRDHSQLARAASDAGWTALTVDAIERTLAPLVEQGLVIRDGSRYLALAIPLGEYAPSAATNRRFGRMVKEIGSPHGDAWIVPVDPAAQRLPGRRTRGGRPPRISAATFTVRGGELLIERGEASRAGERRWHGKEEAEKEAGSSGGQRSRQAEAKTQNQETVVAGTSPAERSRRAAGSGTSAQPLH